MVVDTCKGKTKAPLRAVDILIPGLATLLLFISPLAMVIIRLVELSELLGGS